jgi:hypothetical protein
MLKSFGGAYYDAYSNVLIDFGYFAGIAIV